MAVSGAPERIQVTGQPPASDSSERRANVVLRALIDEMLERVRELSRNGRHWDAGEIARAEAELEALMARVRKAAMRLDGR
jgi:hypothetical protein